MRKNVFWLHHDNLEDGNSPDNQHQKSKANGWEVSMVHAFVRHLVRQGVYASTDIAVLTPYTGQLQKLRTSMQDDFEIVLSDRDRDALAQDGLMGSESSSEIGGTNPKLDNTRRPLMKKKFSDLLRVATVDNFQGEEAKIIIVSLVRSNKERKVGFLKTTNRINVLLSRAQHGMYLIGNRDTYSNVPMWSKVIVMLEASDAIDTSLDLRCPRHPQE
jgi:superfamily I DNA and/or RNA helicase